MTLIVNILVWIIDILGACGLIALGFLVVCIAGLIFLGITYVLMRVLYGLACVCEFIYRKIRRK